MYIKKTKCASLLLPPEKPSFNYRATNAHVRNRAACTCAERSTRNCHFQFQREKKKKNFKLNMVAHASNTKIHADEAGGLLIQVQSGI